MKDPKYFMLWVLFIVEFITAFSSFSVLEKGTEYFLPVVIIGLVSALVFIVITISEVIKSEWIQAPEKIMWVVCIILIFNIAGLLYLILRRKRIIGSVRAA